MRQTMDAYLDEDRWAHEVDKIFRALVKLEGSDLHLKVGQPPVVRVHGTLKPLNRGPIEADLEISPDISPDISEVA